MPFNRNEGSLSRMLIRPRWETRCHERETIRISDGTPIAVRSQGTARLRRYLHLHKVDARRFLERAVAEHRHGHGHGNGNGNERRVTVGGYHRRR